MIGGRDNLPSPLGILSSQFPVKCHPDPTESFTASEVISIIIDGRDLPTLNHLDFSKEFSNSKKLNECTQENPQVQLLFLFVTLSISGDPSPYRICLLNF